MLVEKCDPVKVKNNINLCIFMAVLVVWFFFFKCCLDKTFIYLLVSVT